jgi:hypothetical protein
MRLCRRRMNDRRVGLQLSLCHVNRLEIFDNLDKTIDRFQFYPHLDYQLVGLLQLHPTERSVFTHQRYNLCDQLRQASIVPGVYRAKKLLEEQCSFLQGAYKCLKRLQVFQWSLQM